MPPHDEQTQGEFIIGRMLGELMSDVKGLRVDLNDRHNDNTKRMAAIEARQVEFDDKLEKLWYFRGRVLAIVAMILVGSETVVHFLFDHTATVFLSSMGVK